MITNVLKHIEDDLFKHCLENIEKDSKADSAKTNFKKKEGMKIQDVSLRDTILQLDLLSLDSNASSDFHWNAIVYGMQKCLNSGAVGM
jgi:hypothetical protein